MTMAPSSYGVPRMAGMLFGFVQLAIFTAYRADWVRATRSPPPPLALSSHRRRTRRRTCRRARRRTRRLLQHGAKPRGRPALGNERVLVFLLLGIGVGGGGGLGRGSVLGLRKTPSNCLPR